MLDFEVLNSNSWMEEWCRAYHALSGIYPWVYMNSDYVNNRGYGTDWVKAHCGLWLAGYPSALTVYPAGNECPYKHNGWTLAAWQFTSSLAMGGMKVDGNFFYGDRDSWNAYATASTDNALPGKTVLELAEEVIKGKHGSGNDRKASLGSMYDTVQDKVNELYAKANDVIKGKYGNGQTRKNQLGTEYEIVQYIVNEILGK